MPIRCRSSTAVDFDVVVDAALLGGGNDALLAVVFRSSSAGDHQVATNVSSALCVYRMSHVREQFTSNIRRCFAARQKYVGLQFGNRLCVSLVSTLYTLQLCSFVA